MSADVGVVVAKKLGANVNPFEVVQTMVEYADRLGHRGATSKVRSRRDRSLGRTSRPKRSTPRRRFC